MNIKAFIERHSGNALIAALLVSAVSIVVSLVNTYMTYNFSLESQNKQVKYEALAKFDQSSAAIIEVGGDFISAINNKQDLSNPKEKIKTLAASQIGETESLRKFFSEDNEVTKYQDALSKFSDVAANTFDSTQMKDWVESFGSVIDSKSTLSKELYGKLGVSI